MLYAVDTPDFACMLYSLCSSLFLYYTIINVGYNAVQLSYITAGETWLEWNSSRSIYKRNFSNQIGYSYEAY